MLNNPRSRLYPEKFPDDIIVIAVLIFSALSLYFLIHYILQEKENMIDYSGFLFFRPLISPTFTKIAELVTFCGTGTFLVPSYLLIIAFLIRNNHSKSAIMISTIAISSLLLGWLLKDIFHRSRPSHHLVSGAGGYSFPSGHAFGGFIFTGIVLYLIWQTGKATWLNGFYQFLFLPWNAYWRKQDLSSRSLYNRCFGKSAHRHVVAFVHVHLLQNLIST